MRFSAAWRHAGLFLVLLFAWAGCRPTGEARLDPERNRHFQTGKSLVNSLDYEGAVAEFERALAEHPHLPAAHFELGVLCYQHLHDYAAAIYHFEQFLKFNPSSPHAENVRQFITVCKQELAKTVSLGPVADKVLRDLDELRRENARLRQQLEQAVVKVETNRPARGPMVWTNWAAAAVTNRAVEMRGATNRPRAQPAAPALVPRVYIVRPGDTLASIARRHQIKLSALQAANPGINPKRLLTGQSLNLP